MGKYFIIVCVFFLGCSTIGQHPFSDSELHKAIQSRSQAYTKVYKYNYDDVYGAIISMLESRLYLGVDRKVTTKTEIYTSTTQGRAPLWRYAYLFQLKKIDDNTTEVSLKASGGMGSTSDKDMLEKYLVEELVYQGNTRAVR